MATGDPSVTVCRSGSLTLRAGCRPENARTTYGRLILRTGVDHSFTVGSTRTTDFGPDDKVRALSIPSASVGASNLDSFTLLAGAPNGSQLAGLVGARVTKLDEDGSGTCEFVVGASK